MGRCVCVCVCVCMYYKVTCLFTIPWPNISLYLPLHITGLFKIIFHFFLLMQSLFTSSCHFAMYSLWLSVLMLHKFVLHELTNDFYPEGTNWSISFLNPFTLSFLKQFPVLVLMTHTVFILSILLWPLLFICLKPRCCNSMGISPGYPWLHFLLR
jgi:hypothetical protein